jgi:hypothetical protein
MSRYATAQLDMGPLVVKPRTACRMLDCGNTRLYELLATGELESFLDGRSRKVVVDSIRRYVAQRLDATKVTGAKSQPPRRRGRPPKSSRTEQSCSP